MSSQLEPGPHRGVSEAWPPGFEPFAARMTAAGCSESAIRAFAAQYRQLLAGATGQIAEADLRPVSGLPDAAQLPAVSDGAGIGLDRLVIIKLNGGLGTSMGLAGPKSLLPVHDGLSFLDILARQVIAARQRFGVALPLVFMNSFSTDDATTDALAAYPELADQASVPGSFLQGMVPKVGAADLAPIDWPEDPTKTWCPPGHGEIYQALNRTGLLRQLIDAGFDTAFVSNVDNLGATLDLAILAEIRRRSWAFLMEVADRTPADRKGGHLAHRPDGGLVLRELAQCPPADRDAFQDVERHRYFNTNNLWIHLPTLSDLLASRGGFLDLPLIRNEKSVDPTLADSPRVYQLESAMGAAIALFPHSAAILVPRSRFRPVKKTSDLLGLWSDAYALSPEGDLDLRPARGGREPQVDLDERYYTRMSDLHSAFPYGAPSMRDCSKLTIRGAARFGRAVRLLGDVTLQVPDGERLDIPDGTTLRDQP